MKLSNLSIDYEGIIPEECKVGPITYVNKGWGYENFISPQGWMCKAGEIFVYHCPQEKEEQKLIVDTVKLLYIEKNKELSYHYHLSKSEFFFATLGQIQVTISGRDSKKYRFIMKEQDKIFVPKGFAHTMKGLEEKNILLEVSTLDKPEDSYRIIKGD